MNICSIYIIDHWKIRKQHDGTPFNSARVISNIFFTDPKPKDTNFNCDTVFTLNMMQWAQALTHDMIGTAPKSGELKFYI